MKQTTETNYAELMRRAENAQSRSEAIELINLATRLREHDEHKRVQALFRK